VRKRRLKQGRADAGAVAKQKRKIFLPGEVFFSLTCPLMGDPILFNLSVFLFFSVYLSLKIWYVSEGVFSGYPIFQTFNRSIIKERRRSHEKPKN